MANKLRMPAKVRQEHLEEAAAALEAARSKELKKANPNRVNWEEEAEHMHAVRKAFRLQEEQEGRRVPGTLPTQAVTAAAAPADESTDPDEDEEG